MTIGNDEIVNAIEQAEVEKSIREAESVYDTQGRMLASPQKGINIICMTDGTVKKVIIK
ncbi:MAG: hypothetical protein IJM81_05095 [Prevotella sp.]|nr:hypothetical protein [Prevotella sp.]